MVEQAAGDPIVGTQTSPRDTTKTKKSRRKLWGLVLAGAGVVGIGTGVGLGLAAQSQFDEAKDDGHCNEELECNPTGFDLINSAQDKALLADISYGVGGALLITGVVLYFTGPSEKASSEGTVRVTPGPGALGLGFATSF